MSQQSIFSRSRFEYEGTHLYFLDKARLLQIEGNSPIILYGSRGTGKTTLLNALNWKEQVKNPSLVKVLGGKRFVDKYIGIYVKLPKVNTEALSKWQNEDESLYGQIFAYYLDLIWLEQLANALGELTSNNEINLSPTDERNLCNKIIKRFPELTQHSTTNPNLIGFYDLEDIFRMTRESIECSSAYGESVISAHQRLKVSGQIGDLGRSISKLFHSIWTKRNYGEYKIKVCFDECECLDTFQVKVLSTLIRLGEHPTFFIYSFISLPIDFYSTLIPNIYLAKADIDHIALDEMSDSEFEGFSTGVVNVRISAELPSDEYKFSNETTFGKLCINSLIEKVLIRSENKNAHDFLDKAKGLVEHPYYDYYKSEGIPYYQAYLVDKLNVDINKSLKPTWAKNRRQQESKEIRKKMVAAYLSICSDYKLDPIYSSADMVMQLSDKSIRDYLWQMHEIYIESQKTLSEFIRTEISPEIQDKAIKRASSNKIKSLPSSPLTEPGKIYRIVSGLGLLTSHIQSSSADYSHLKSSERGLFVIKLDRMEDTKQTRELISMIVEAAEAGFLKITFRDPTKICFRIHTSLAAYYRTSYRGAYYNTPIDFKSLSDLKDATGEKELHEKVKTISRTLYNMDNVQLSMDID